jgi:hypothetical protein
MTTGMSPVDLGRAHKMAPPVPGEWQVPGTSGAEVHVSRIRLGC